MSGASSVLERIDFDFSNPDDSQNIGVFLRAGSDGDQLSSTLNTGKESLDINITGIESNVDLNVDIQVDDLVVDDAVDTEAPLKTGTHVNSGASVLPAISADGDKADMISDLYRRQWMSSAPNVGWKVEALTTNAMAATEEQADSSKQAGRQSIWFQNQATKSIFIGPTGVLTTTGYEVAKGQAIFFDFGEALDIFTIAVGTSEPFRMVQIG